MFNKRKIFGIDVTFLAAGDVFRTGLKHAAQSLGVEYQSALFHSRTDRTRPNSELPRLIRDFVPDLILVIHGRGYVGAWKDDFRQYKHALWLTDEPYEVDDAEEYGKQFDFVFSNDRNTLHRHRNCVYLPTCYDPVMHYDADCERIYKCGFIGGHNRMRDALLQPLADAKLLDYVIGGPWRSMAHLEKSRNVPPIETANYYQHSKVIINVWREEHHFNFKQHIKGYSMNPRIYESLACGALCISEHRPEIDEIFPELPTFTISETRGGPTAEELDDLVSQVDRLVNDDNLRLDLLAKCRARLTGHTYADRL